MHMTRSEKREVIIKIIYQTLILDKIDDKYDLNSIIKEYKKKKLRKVISKRTSSIMRYGLESVVAKGGGKSAYIEGYRIGGKTGTAQQDKTRANHALFISYAPYENPEISVTIRIANGYESGYAAQTARDVYKYYYGLAEGEESKGLAEIILAKHRNGSTGVVNMRFRANEARFVDANDDDYYDGAADEPLEYESSMNLPEFNGEGF